MIQPEPGQQWRLPHGRVLTITYLWGDGDLSVEYERGTPKKERCSRELLDGAILLSPWVASAEPGFSPSSSG